MELVASSTPGEVERFAAINALVQRSVLTRLVCQELSTRTSDGEFSRWRTDIALGFLMHWITSLPGSGEYFQASFGIDSMTVPDDCVHLIEEIRDGAKVCDDLLMLQSADTASDVYNDMMRIEKGLEVYWRKYQSPAWPPSLR